ncbi:MAG TPA: restriction endonuclease subunit S [Nitrospira sp.]|nr:restriction endonuclease subunit S [Nitrospira sp.]HNP42160.1 restriction endonuclease subunit S [Nitrospira sp.]
MPDNKNLKPGWKICRFDQMATNVNVRIDNPSESGMEHYVGLEHLDSNSLKIRRWGTPDDVEATKLMFKKGDIIFGRRRAYQRKLGIAEFDGICSAHAMVLRAKPDVVLPEFLPFFMQSDLFMKRAVEISVGSLSPTINWKTMAAQEFALPPVEEQQRIVKLMRAIVEAIETHVEALACHERMRRATQDDLLTGNRWAPDTGSDLPPGWNSQPLGSICELINGFGFKPQDWRESGLPIIRIQNLNGSTQFNYFSGDVDPKFHVKNGDLLFAWAGVPGVSFGARIWKGQEAVLNQHIFRVVPRGDVDRSWLFEVLNHITPAIERRAHGFKTSLLHIKRSELVKMLVKVPPLHVQKEIAELSADLTRTRQALDNRLLALKEIHRLTLTWTGGHA